MEQPSLKYIDELASGDEAFKAQLISILKKEFPEEENEYYSAVNQDDYERLAQIVHKLKHKLSILSLESGHALASEYESQLKQENKKLHEEFNDILIKIRIFLETI